jgi:hypothetical protein
VVKVEKCYLLVTQFQKGMLSKLPAGDPELPGASVMNNFHTTRDYYGLGSFIAAVRAEGEFGPVDDRHALAVRIMDQQLHQDESHPKHGQCRELGCSVTRPRS